MFETSERILAMKRSVLSLLAAMVLFLMVPVKAQVDSAGMIQGLTIGKENFDKLVVYIETMGYTLKGNTGGRYTYYDSRGNRHVLEAVRVDPITLQRSAKGRVFWINVMCRRHAADSRGRINYLISTKSIWLEYPDSSKAAIVTFGYNELLHKIAWEK